MSSRTAVHVLNFERAYAICRQFEEVNGIATADFVERYHRGLVEPSPWAMRWVSTYETMLRLAPSQSGLAEDDLLIPA